MKKKKNKFSLDKKQVAKLDNATMKLVLAGDEADPDFLSIFACHTRRKCLLTVTEGCSGSGTILATP